MLSMHTPYFEIYVVEAFLTELYFYIRGKHSAYVLNILFQHRHRQLQMNQSFVFAFMEFCGCINVCDSCSNLFSYLAVCFNMRLQTQMLCSILSLFVLGVQSMISKRASYVQKHVGLQHEHKFRANVADLFLNNDISGSRARELLQDHVDADKDNVQDLLLVGKCGIFKNNIARDLLRKLKKRTAWPPLYWAKIRVFDLQMQVSRKKWMPFILPHELIWSLYQLSDGAAIFDHSGLCKQSLHHVETCAAALNCPVAKIIAASIWGDGVPMNFDRTQSLEVFSLSLPGLSETNRNLRFPITVVPKKYVVKNDTKDDICAVIAWSFQQLAAGRFPVFRHDEDKWLASDAWRKKKTGLLLPKCILAEVKGDWAFMKDTFRFPQHNENMGCCWLCSVCPGGIRNATSSAPWRNERLSHWQLLSRIQQQGLSISPLFGTPFLSSKQFLIDWLHVADQGISAIFLAGLFFLALPKMPGQTQDQKISFLYGLIFEYYEANDITARLDNLTFKMLGKRAKPKLRAKAAEVRALIDFAANFAQTYLNPEDLVEQSVASAALYLQKCYSNLSHNDYNAASLAHSCRMFCVLICELEKHTTFFRVIPKQHLFQELCEFSDINPSLTWCYRDEDFGGSLAALSKVRGGCNRAPNIAKAVLLKFCAQHKLPRL